MDSSATDYPFLIRAAADPSYIDHVGALMAANAGQFLPSRVDRRRRRFWTITGGGAARNRRRPAPALAH